MKNNRENFKYLAIALICLFVDFAIGRVPVAKIVGLVFLINIMSKNKDTFGQNLKVPTFVIIAALVVPFIINELLVVKMFGSIDYGAFIEMAMSEDETQIVAFFNDFLDSLAGGSALLITSAVVSLVCDIAYTFCIVKYVKTVATLCANKEDEVYLERKSSLFFNLNVAVNVIGLLCAIIAVSLIPVFIDFIKEVEDGVQEFSFVTALFSKGIMVGLLGLAMGIVAVVAFVMYIQLIVKLFRIKDVKDNTQETSYVNVDAE